MASDIPNDPLPPEEHGQSQEPVTGSSGEQHPQPGLPGEQRSEGAVAGDPAQISSPVCERSPETSSEVETSVARDNLASPGDDSEVIAGLQEPHAENDSPRLVAEPPRQSAIEPVEDSALQVEGSFDMEPATEVVRVVPQPPLPEEPEPPLPMILGLDAITPQVSSNIPEPDSDPIPTAVTSPEPEAPASAIPISEASSDLPTTSASDVEGTTNISAEAAEPFENSPISETAENAESAAGVDAPAAASSDPGPSPAVDAEDLIESQPLDRTVIGSGWLQTSAELFQAPPPAAPPVHSPDPGDSDIFGSAGATGASTASQVSAAIDDAAESSSILSVPPARGSSQYDSPAEATSEVAEFPDDVAVPPVVPQASKEVTAAGHPGNSQDVSGTTASEPYGDDFGHIDLSEVKAGDDILEQVASSTRLPAIDAEDLQFDEGDDTMVDQPIPVPLPPLPSDGGISFGGVSASSSSSNLFSDVTSAELDLGSSGAPVGDPEDIGILGPSGGESSIFDQVLDDPTEAHLPGFDEPVSELDMNLQPPSPSSIFSQKDLESPAAASPSDVLTDNPDTPSELDMEVLPAPPSSIFRRPQEAGQGAVTFDQDSIFDQEFEDLTEIEFPGMTDDPSELDMTAIPAPPSSIFLGKPPANLPGQSENPANQGAVSFDLPTPSPQDFANQGHLAETSGLIDWSAPPSEEELKQLPLGSTGVTGELHQARAEADLDRFAAPPKPPSVVAGPPARPHAGSLIEDSWAQPEPLSSPAPATPRSTPPMPADPPKLAEHDAATRPQSRGGVLIGGAAGLLIGLGLAAGAYFSGMMPQQSASVTAPQQQATGELKSPLVSTPQNPELLLQLGNYAQVLNILDAAGETADPSIRARRGQARWLHRLQELAQTQTTVEATDLEFQKAEADLTAASEGNDVNAAIQAALHLGLMKEVAGDIAAARQLYSNAARRYPQAKALFEAALDRLNVLHPSTGGKTESRMPPATAEELAYALVLALCLLQAEPSVSVKTPEPGLLFWRAVNEANAGRYDQAIAILRESRKHHDQLRLQYAATGINATSDPLGQIFLHCCDDLRELWILKRDLYQHPKLGDLVKQNGVTKALDQLAMTTETITKLDAEKKTLLADLESLAKKTKDLEASVLKIDGEKEAALKELADTKKILESRSKELLAAEAQRKSAETIITAILAELKSHKLIDELEPTKLPSVMKTVAATAVSADAKKAAEALLEARKKLEIAQQAVKKAEEDAEKAKSMAKETLDGVDKKISAIQLEWMKKLAAEQALAKQMDADWRMKLKALEEAQRVEVMKREEAVAAAAAKAARELAAREAELQRKLQTQAEEYEQKLADLRAGVRVPLSNLERQAQDRASRAFSDGMIAYQAGRFTAAESLFQAATQEDPYDARYWYLLGLARWHQGNQGDAEVAFKKGAELEARNRPATSTVSASLERIQGAARQALSVYRP